MKASTSIFQLATALLVAVIANAFLACPALAAGKPNVILILADDLGYETIGANGGTSYKTPVIDGLAAKGVRFDRCYVQPLCTPTRVQLMTSMYNVRNYINFGNMYPKAVTFGNLFKNGGYVTCIAGKWQLGYDIELPKKFGFDEYCLWQHNRRPSRYANPGLEINGIQKDYPNGEYGPDVVNDYVLDFIQRKKDSPFFVYYPMMLTHSPYQATPDSAGWDKKATEDTGKKDDKYFKDMVEYMDKLIGKLTARLDALGLRENTIILFVGDNGTGAGTRSMMGDKLVIGAKGKTIETGMRVPLVVSWPAKAAKGKVCNDLVDSTDFLPTICAAAGVNIPGNLKIDGHSFLPQVLGEKGMPRDWIYSWYSPRQNNDKAIREMAFNHGYKLYRTGEFFDLKKDVLEKSPMNVADLSGEAAAAAKTLQGALDQFKDARPSDLPEPSESTAQKEKKEKKKGKKKQNEE